MNDVEEPAIDMLGHQHRRVLSLRPRAFFIVPILNCSDYMRLVGLRKHNLDFVHRVIVWIFQKNDRAAHRMIVVSL
jgi:hypothetical protein